MKNKFFVDILIVLGLFIISFGLVGCYVTKNDPAPVVVVTNFEECVAAGNLVMESYPRQCRNDVQSFVENIGNALAKTEVIRIDYPRPNQTITSPLTVKGQARGSWFFEASFPVVLTDWDGLIIAQGIATAKGDWMTMDFVPFEATLTFTVDNDAYSNRGSLILKKDNPSGLPEHDDALEIPVMFVKVVTPPKACTQEAKRCPDGTYVGRTGPNCEFLSCSTAAVKAGLVTNLNQKIIKNGVSITPIAVVSDSRCPTDVTCVWAGEILVKTQLEKEGVIHTVELKEGEGASIGGSVVTLMSVLPEKKSTVAIQAEDYRFTFEVASIPGACIKDADCLSSKYTCEETKGSGTVCPSTDPTCVPAHTRISGECKMKVGNECAVDSQCVAGSICHNSICTAPIGKQCTGANDTNCPVDFVCVQSCGPPVSRQDDPPPLYFCQLKSYLRACPICLAKNTLIDTSLGVVNVQDIKVGMLVWSENGDGYRTLEPVVKMSKTVVPTNHKVVDLVLDDGRRLEVSPLHPTVDGRVVGDLVKGDFYDGAKVFFTDLIAYEFDATYDLLPAGDTGSYRANGILLNSTLH